jgi:hypothetical protein
MAFDDRRDGRITRPQFYKGVDETAAEFRLDFQPRDKQVPAQDRQRQGQTEGGSVLTCSCCGGVLWCVVGAGGVPVPRCHPIQGQLREATRGKTHTKTYQPLCGFFSLATLRLFPSGPDFADPFRSWPLCVVLSDPFCVVLSRVGCRPFVAVTCACAMS